MASRGDAPGEPASAGFGAFEDQLADVYTSGMKPHELRSVDTFISEVYPASLQFKDGPNPGRGSCQRDSGGSVYARRPSATARPVLVGLPVSGPACDEGIGFDTDIRSHVAWIEETARVTLALER